MYEDEYISIGRVVISKSGRDRGKRFIVIEILDEDYILIADGDLRKLEKPKKKKLKHVAIENSRADEIADKLKKGEHMNNSDIRKYLNNV